MRKKLLIIGNKPLDKDYSGIIGDFDLVMRINRMLNYEKSRGKTDLWLSDVFESSEKLYDSEDQGKFLASSSAICFSHDSDNARKYLGKIGYEGNVTIVDFDSIPIRKYIPMHHFGKYGLRVTNVVWMLIYCLEKYYPLYDIHTLGIGRRDFLSDSCAHSCHCSIYMAENKLISSLIGEGVITVIDDDEWKTFKEEAFSSRYVGNIQVFSSFWHSEIDFLPRFVVASINSFVSNGCPYHLYTYKKYTNVPEGCIVEDANEIIHEDEFFLGSRGDYASFADYFRIMLINKKDTAWTDTDNFFISDDFPTKTVLMLQNGRIQNGFFYIEDNDEGRKLKRILLEFYENPTKIQEYDNEEMRQAKEDISRYSTKKEQLSNAKWGIGGSCLLTNAIRNVNLEGCIYDYYRYFNCFQYQSQYMLWDEKDKDIFHKMNGEVRILVLSMALLQREPAILGRFRKDSYVAKLFSKYVP